jgi:hypothetical protein
VKLMPREKNVYQQTTEIRAVELRSALGFLEKRGEPVKVRNT